MAHARAFSFTDDAISVGLPTPSPMSRVPSISGSTAIPPSADTALLHFQLRRIQSHWYQTLFQSDPTDLLPDAASFIWQMCHDMREWAESLPDTLPGGIQELFDLELRYSYVYCIAPSARAPNLTAYGRVLIFEHAIAYVDRIYAVAYASANTAFYTYHDALKVYFMGSQFVAVLRDAVDALLSGGSVPIPLSLPGQAPPPPLPERPGGNNLDRSLRSLDRVSLTLEKYGERWDDALKLKESFEMISADVVNELRARRNAQVGQMRLQQMDPSQQSQQQQQQQQNMQTIQNQQQNMQWPGVEAAQMLQGGNRYES